jgi:iron complex outermembrane receptor protein
MALVLTVAVASKARADEADAVPASAASSAAAQRANPVASSTTTRLGTVKVNAAALESVAGFRKVEINGASNGSQVTADSASLVRRVPGAALNYNGPLAGQIQYRGLYGAVNNVLVDGMHINPGGPNWMDTPLHYLPRPELDTLTVQRGISPVADGIETLGVTVRARSRQARFTDSSTWHAQGAGMFGYGSVNNGYYVGGMLGSANDQQRFDVVAARDHAGDARYGDGTIRDSAFARTQAGADYGVRWGANSLSLHVRYDDTGVSANPVFPLDTELLHTAIARVNYTRKLDDGDLDARLYYIHVAHAMDNYSRRPTPDSNPMMPGPDVRRVPASARNWGLDLSRTHSLWDGQAKFGINVYLASNSATVTDPDMPAFRVHIFNNAERNLYSAYAQWQGRLAARTQLTAGARYTRVDMNAGPGQVPMMLPMPAQRLTQAFNAADHKRDDNNVDAMVRLDYQLDETHDIEFSLARKTHSPSYLERYAYIPLEANAGLADGNNYVGDINLKPEIAYQSDFGLNWHTDRFTFTPRVFLTHIENHIQGLPIDSAGSMRNADTVKVSTLNGDPTPLRFSNVQAQLYGVDMGGLVQLRGNWQLDGALSYTRGLRAGANDNLYRIAPLHGHLRLGWQLRHWHFAVTQMFSSAQRNISRANMDTRLQDPSTSGYTLTGLSAGWSSGQGMDVQLGVSNLFNRTYYDALAGYNRVMGSDIPVGNHLPGHGRNVHLQVTQRF